MTDRIMPHIRRKRPKPDKPTGPSGPSGPTSPTLPTTPTAATGPSGPTGPTLPATVTTQTDFRLTGNTNRQEFRDALRRTLQAWPTMPSPLEPEADAIYDVLAPHGLTRLYAAQAWHERHNDTYKPDEAYYPHRYKNVMAMKDGSGGWMRFATYADGALVWAQRILSPNGAYRNARSITQYIHVYAPAWDGNDEAKYVADVVTQINGWPLLGAAPGPTGTTGSTGPTPPTPPLLTGWKLAGSDKPLWLPDDMGFEVVLTPKGPNRSGKPMLWSGVTQHTTNNVRAGTDARSHSRWQDAGAEGNPGIGVHFYVDDKRVVQKIPVDEQGVHSGDWRNQAHVAVELCVNADRNAAQAERNSQALDAGLLYVLGTTAEKNLYPHTFNAAGHCPRLSTHWGIWERDVDRRLAAMRPGPAKG